MPYPYTPPSFLQGQTVDDIHRRMMNALPDDIDKSEAQIPWDFTRPAAIEKAEFVEFELNETIKLMFVHWSYGPWLDLHAEGEGLTRRQANRASGYLTVKGRPGITIAQGFQFATPANLTASVIFEATEAVTLDNGSYTIRDTANPATAVIRLTLNQPPGNRVLTLTIRPTQADPENQSEMILQDGDTVLEQFIFDTPEGESQADMLLEAVDTQGSAHFTLTKLAESAEPLATVNQAAIGTTIPIQAVEGGTIGNVPPDAIFLMVRPNNGITYVTNPEATTGGTPEEDDDTLRERVLEVIRYGISFTGCDADYVRWAREVPGVGQAVTQAEWAGPGTVRLFIIDANGIPANQQILDAVYSHIIRPDNRMERLAPIGATLTVTAPSPIYIDIQAAVTLREDESLEVVTGRYRANLDAYWLEATTENDVFDVQSGIAQNYVKYVFVGATLAATAGISNYDHASLTVNGGSSDILIAIGTFPVTREVILIE